MLGQAVVAPGLSTRTEALYRAGQETGITCIGVAGMLCFAAVIESYLRQSHLSTSARLVFAAGSALLWTVFIVYGFLREQAASRLTSDSADEVR